MSSVIGAACNFFLFFLITLYVCCVSQKGLFIIHFMFREVILIALKPLLIVLLSCSGLSTQFTRNANGHLSILPHRRDWNFLGTGGSVRPKNLKKCMKLYWNFQRGGEGA